VYEGEYVDDVMVSQHFGVNTLAWLVGGWCGVVWCGVVFIHSSIHPSIHPSIHSFIHSFIHKTTHCSTLQHGRGKLTNPDGSLQHTGLWDCGAEAEGSVKIQRVSAPINTINAFSPEGC
jgi:hypothetical protein